jgi:NADH-quinone oxidoreductase subunit A
MFETYFPIIFLFLLVLFVAIVMLGLAYFIGPKRVSREKLSVYECGTKPIGDARIRIPIKFYLVAILFIIFDIEIAFLYPWAVIFRKLGLFGLIEMGVFIFILLVGYFYIIKNGGLRWE